jgi:hypothetical protein
MNTTANRLTGKKDGDTVDAADSFVNEKVSASCAHGRSSTQSTVDDPGREESGSDRASTSLLHAFDDIIIGNTDIPKFLVDHKSTLRFPETVRVVIALFNEFANVPQLTAQKTCFLSVLLPR